MDLVHELFLWNCSQVNATEHRNKSTLVQVMAWCHQATSHYLRQCWPMSLSSYGVTGPQWVYRVFWRMTVFHYKVSTVFVQIKRRAPTDVWRACATRRVGCGGRLGQWGLCYKFLHSGNFSFITLRPECSLWRKKVKILIQTLLKSVHKVPSQDCFR